MVAESSSACMRIVCRSFSLIFICNDCDIWPSPSCSSVGGFRLTYIGLATNCRCSSRVQQSVATCQLRLWLATAPAKRLCAVKRPHWVAVWPATAQWLKNGNGLSKPRRNYLQHCSKRSNHHDDDDDDDNDTKHERNNTSLLNCSGDLSLTDRHLIDSCSQHHSCHWPILKGGGGGGGGGGGAGGWPQKI